MYSYTWSPIALISITNTYVGPLRNESSALSESDCALTAPCHSQNKTIPNENGNTNSIHYYRMKDFTMTFFKHEPSSLSTITATLRLRTILLAGLEWLDMPRTWYPEWLESLCTNKVSTRTQDNNSCRFAASLLPPHAGWDAYAGAVRTTNLFDRSASWTTTQTVSAQKSRANISSLSLQQESPLGMQKVNN